MVATLLCAMAGCGSEPETIIDPTTPIRSESGRFFGLPYGEYDLPHALQHRTEAEIAATGLTAQDVLNAYDQLAIDVLKARLSHKNYDRLSDEARMKATAEFVSISPASYGRHDSENDELVMVPAPFFYKADNFSPKQSWQSRSENTFSVYPVALTITQYVDGVIVPEVFDSVCVEPSAMEQMLAAYGETEPYLLDRATLIDKLGGEENYYDFVYYLDSYVYDPITVTRETITNANDEQLEAIYNVIHSLRSLLLEQKLPESGN